MPLPLPVAETASRLRPHSTEIGPARATPLALLGGTLLLLLVGATSAQAQRLRDTLGGAGTGIAGTGLDVGMTGTSGVLGTGVTVGTTGRPAAGSSVPV